METEIKELTKLKKVFLVNWAKSFGLPGTGTKAKLAQNISLMTKIIRESK